MKGDLDVQYQRGSMKIEKYYKTKKKVELWPLIEKYPERYILSYYVPKNHKHKAKNSAFMSYFFLLYSISLRKD